MEGSVRFRRFLNAVLQSRRPAETTGEPAPASGRPRLSRTPRSVEAVLDAIESEAGTLNVSAIELEQLLAAPSALAARLRQLLETRRYLDRRLMALFDDVTDTRLMLAFLLVVLHHGVLAAALAEEAAYLERFAALIALRVLIERERLTTRTPEAQALVDLRRECRQGRNRLLAHLVTLAEASRGVTDTHQAFVNDRLVRLAELRMGWQVAQRDSIAFINPPTPLEIAHGCALRDALRERDRIQPQIDDLSQEDADLVVALRATPMRDRGHVRDDLRRVRDRNRTLVARRRELNATIRELRRQLGYRRAPVVVDYLDALDRGLNRPRARDERDRALRTHDQLIQPYSRLRLFTGDETQAWTDYRTLLQLLVAGYSNVSIELAFDAYFRCYPAYEANQDWGFREQWTGGTYPGHPENAIDLTGQIGRNVCLAAPLTLPLPARLRAADELPVPYDYAGSTVVASSLSVSSDAQDIFAKLSIGLLRQRGARSMRSDDIAQIIEANEDSDYAPASVGDHAQRNFDATRLLSGLAHHHLTEVQNVGGLERERAGILATLEQQVAAELGLPAGTEVFRRDRTDASSGHVGVGRLIAVPDHGAVYAAIVAVLSADRHCGRSDRNGLCHRIWRLLLSLLAIPGVRPNRYGVSATVEHRYANPLASGIGGLLPTGYPELVITAFYTHLRRTDPAMRSAGTTVQISDLVGELGTTGNAVSGHLHLELNAVRDGIALGTLLPHEFFPFTAEYLTWLDAQRAWG